MLCQRVDARGGVAQRDQDDLRPQGRHPLLILGQARIMFFDNCKASKCLHSERRRGPRKIGSNMTNILPGCDHSPWRGTFSWSDIEICFLIGSPTFLPQQEPGRDHEPAVGARQCRVEPQLAGGARRHPQRVLRPGIQVHLRQVARHGHRRRLVRAVRNS